MGDPSLELEVLRELDEAGATYFALTLHDPASRQCLVSTLGGNTDSGGGTLWMLNPVNVTRPSLCSIFAIRPAIGARE